MSRAETAGSAPPAIRVLRTVAPRARAALRAMLAAGLLTACTAEPVDPIERVVVIGVDGLGPAGMAAARTPHLDALVAAGAASFDARAVLPTTSAPNWASMIMGIEPAVHGILEKKWYVKQTRPRTSVCGEAPGRLPPNVFRAVRAARPGARVVAIYEWAGFGHLFEADDAEAVQTGTPTQTAGAAVERIATDPPVLLFVQFVHVDNRGHRFGWGSPEYVEAVEQVDAKIGEVLAALDAAGARGRTAVLVTSDHGGTGRNHGGDTPEEVRVPWILAGPGVRRGHSIDVPIATPDTAATVLALLGIDPPACWTGRPVTAALRD